jgi:uncharacterized protein (DUF924 family)
VPPEDVLAFWFGQPPVRHFRKDPVFDQEIRDRFGALHGELVLGEHDDWLTTPRGRLAAIIVLDQFSRNMFRDTPGMFASDPQALQLALEGLARGDDRALSEAERSFFYMPLMHAEDRAVQDRCVELFRALGIENNLKFAVMHRDIVQRFGRFPHRNAVLGRTSTPEEVEFLAQPGSSF